MDNWDMLFHPMQHLKKFIGSNVANVPNGEKFLDGFMKKGYLMFGIPLLSLPSSLIFVQVLRDEYLGD
jgi:hypothetical protein